jgi:predicted O-methyltransferase YrrM
VGKETAPGSQEQRFAAYIGGLAEAAQHVHLAVSHETGILLYVLARGTRARSIVEFGTSFGISTLHLAAAREYHEEERNE